MKRLILSGAIAGLLFASCNDSPKTNTKKDHIENYPETAKKPVVDDYFGTKITDNYRWLEDDRSSETEAWVKAENEVTFNYLDKIPYREQLKERLSELWNIDKVGPPVKEGAFS